MRVRFTAEARARLHHIYNYVTTESPRRVPEYGDDRVREILERPYRIIYRLTETEVHILTVMHQRQLLPDNLPSPDTRHTTR